LKHCDQVIKWPDKEEHRNFSGRIRKVQRFVNCVCDWWYIVSSGFCTHGELRGLLNKERVLRY